MGAEGAASCRGATRPAGGRATRRFDTCWRGRACPRGGASMARSHGRDNRRGLLGGGCVRRRGCGFFGGPAHHRNDDRPSRTVFRGSGRRSPSLTLRVAEEITASERRVILAGGSPRVHLKTRLSRRRERGPLPRDACSWPPHPPFGHLLPHSGVLLCFSAPIVGEKGRGSRLVLEGGDEHKVRSLPYRTRGETAALRLLRSSLPVVRTIFLPLR
jgi:hypothetical protein